MGTASKIIKFWVVASSRYICEGIPDPSQYGTKAHPHDVQKNPHHYSSLNENSVDRVKRDGAMFGISASRVSYVVGYFKDSLPQLIKNEPNIQFAAVRLVGDTYWSTMEAIEVLYLRLSPGGFLVIDDFTDWDSCRDAIYDYRKEIWNHRKHFFSTPLDRKW